MLNKLEKCLKTGETIFSCLYVLWLVKVTSKIWATSWENLFLPYTNNKGADQPAHPCSLVNAFVVRCLDSIIPLLAIIKISRLASFWSWAGRFEFKLVKNPRRQVFLWQGSNVNELKHNKTYRMEHSLVLVFLGSQRTSASVCAKWLLWLDYGDVQADLSLH